MAVGRIQVTPSEMDEIARRVKSLSQDWNQVEGAIIGLVEQMNAMWDGDANTVFADFFRSERPKFQQLLSLMDTFHTAILRAADEYRVGEDRVRSVVSRGR